MTNFIFIAIIIAAGCFWFSSMKARETALSAVKAYCRNMELQLLDDYVALNGFCPKLNDRGKIRIWRSYGFEFSSTGLERYNGNIVMDSGRVKSIELEPHRDPHQSDTVTLFEQHNE